MDPATIENLNHDWSPQDTSKFRRLKVILPQFYAALAIFAINLSHEIFEAAMYQVIILMDLSSSSRMAYVIMTWTGLLAGGIIAQFTGARVTVMLPAVTSILGWITLGWITSEVVLQWTFFIVVLTKGMMQAPAYVYLAEISQPNMRNAIMAAMCVSANIGSIYIYLAGTISAKIPACINIVFALLGLVGMFFLPDSPYWLANKGRYNEVVSSLAWFRGRTTTDNVKFESKPIIDKANSSPTAWKLFGQKSLYMPALIVGYVFLASTFVRTFYVTYFPHIGTILTDFRYHDLIILACGISTVYTLIVFVVLVVAIGKRIMILISLIGGSMALLAASILGYLKGNDILSLDVYPWLLLICLAVAYLSCITGVVSVPLILNGELFPSKLRYFGAGFGLFFMYAVQAASNNLYFAYFASSPGALLVLALVSMFGIIPLLWLFPRTENKSLMEIENSSTSISELTRKK